MIDIAALVVITIAASLAIVIGVLLAKKYVNLSSLLTSQNTKVGYSVAGNFVRELTNPITESYKISKSCLGEGVSSKCFIGNHVTTDRKYAIKSIDIRDETEKKYYEREFRILKTVGEHYNIVRLFEVYRSPTNLHFVMELCTGGHLEEALGRQPDHKFKEVDVKKYVVQLLSAVGHCHAMGVCHRDIKLQNILMDTIGSDASIKLIDFGNAKEFVGKLPMTQIVGTPYAMAPEMLKKKYDEKCDLWSIGVVIFYLLCGEAPFKQLQIPNEPKVANSSLASNILMGRYEFLDDLWEGVSVDAKHFVAICLQPDSSHRPSCKELLKLPWCLAHRDDIESNFLKPSAARSLSTFLRRKKVDGLGSASMLAVAFTMPPHKAKDMREMFQQIDVDGSGWVDRAEFNRACREVCPDMDHESIDALFRTIDQDDNKQISFLEFVAAMVDPRDLNVNEINMAFKLLDMENKGYITHVDLHRVLSTDISKSRKKLNSLESSDFPGRFGHVVETFGFHSQPPRKFSSVKHFDLPDESATKLPIDPSIVVVEEQKGSLSEVNDTCANVTMKERQKNLEERIKSIIQQADVDNDGRISYAEFVLSMSNGNIVADNSSMVTSSQSPRGEQCPKHTLTFFFTSIFGLLIPPHSNTSAKVSPATGRSKSVGKLSTNKSKSQSFSKKTNRGKGR